MTNFDEYRDVFVVADTIDDVVHPVTYELIGQARRIAKELGQLVQVMLLGENVQAEAEELVAHGADIVHVFESPLLKYYTTDGYTKVLTDFFEDHKPNILLIGATNNGRDLAPRMSGRMQNGVVADCTIRTVDTEEGLVEWTRPALGGTSYTPPNPLDLNSCWDELIARCQELEDNPLEQSLLLYAEMARNQFFGDGNKRTALLMMNGNLIQNGLCPITITKSREVEYRTALIGYYESPEQHRIQFFDFLKQEQQTMLKRWGYEIQDINETELGKTIDTNPKEGSTKHKL